jgi:UDP-2,3-diacylglucosamine hydrolase
MRKPLYFISDVHFYLKFSNSEDEKINRISALFDEIIEKQGSLIMVGDFFDFWFGYKSVIPRHFFRILCKLKQLRDAGCLIHYIGGNHDYWLDGFWEEDLGVIVHRHPLEMVLDNKRFFIAHGDGIDEKDHGYHLLSSVLRNRFFIKCFSLIPPPLAYGFARAISHTSRKFDNKDPQIIKRDHEIMKHFVNKKFTEGFDYVILGHYHQPEEFHKDNHVFLNCGDWLGHYSYGVYDGELKLYFQDSDYLKK